MPKPTIAPMFKDKPNFRGDTFILKLDNGMEHSFFSESMVDNYTLGYLGIPT